MDGCQVGAIPAMRHSAAARLDRLPIGTYHRQVMWLLAYVFFFELGDLNNFAFAAPEIRVAWNLSIATIGLVTSGAFLGMFIGATTGGWFSDRVGRKKALILSTIWYSGFSLINAFVWNTTGLFLARVLTGMGLSAMTVIGMTYISEIFPAKQRGAFQGWIMTIGLFGIPATAQVARFLIPWTAYGWRLVFVWGSLGMLILFFSPLLEESPRWYENQGRLAEADAVLERIEKRIKVEYGELPPVPDGVPITPKSGKFGELFAPSIRPRTIMLIFVWVFQTLAAYGFQAWVPTLLAVNGFTIVKSLLFTSMMQLGAPFGALLAALISDRWERKWWITIVSLVIAFFGLMYGSSFKTWSIITFGFGVAMFIQTFIPLMYTYAPECYPTEIRNTGSGLGYGVGRLSNAFGPMVIAFLFTHYGYTSVFIYIGMLWIAVALIVGMFGPNIRTLTPPELETRSGQTTS